MQTIIRIYSHSIAILLLMTITLLSTESIAQSNLRIYDDIGGSGSSNQTEDSNDNSTIYIVGGLLVAGILAYALFFKEKKNDADTTAAASSSTIYSNLSKFESHEEEIQKIEERMPVDIFMGIRNNEAIINDRVYQVGVRLKL